MRRIPAILDARGNVAAIPRNRYEGAFPSPNRSALPEAVQGAKRDVSRFTRIELLRKARYLWKNSPTVRALVERLVVYTIGTGLHPTPTSSSEEWNLAARKAWRAWSRRADLQSRLPFESLQRVVARGVFLDGDEGTLLTHGPSGRARIQLVESHRITDGRVRLDEPDGVNLDDFGRAASYSYALDDYALSQDCELIPADQFVLHYLPERPEQYRGVTILAAAINAAHDVDDILALEKAAVKDASSKTDIIKTASGEDEGDDGFGPGASLFKNPSDPATEETEDRRYYKEVFGPEARVMKHDDEFTPYVPQRPSPAWQGFMEFLTNTICLSTGLPPSLLFGTKVGGADSRRELASAQRVIEVWQQEFANGFQRVYEFVLRSEIDAGFLKNPPADWDSAEWQCPPRLTVDSGRDSAADRADVVAGLLTHEEYFSRWGLDWREELEESAREAEFKKKLAEKYGLAVSDFSLRATNELNNTPQKGAPDANAA